MTSESPHLLADRALAYRDAGLAVLPARTDKRPAVGTWKDYQTRLPTAVEVGAWFANTQVGCCVICGAVSGHLEVIDFDCAGSAFNAWSALVIAEAPGLVDRLVIAATPSGGWHVAYRCSEAVDGNLKLAQQRENLDGPALVERYGKPYQPRQDRAGHWHLLLTLIETRGEGGLVLCAPTPGYQVVQGDLRDLPVLTTEERGILLRCARAMNMVLPDVIDPQPIQLSAGGIDDRPGDAWNRQGDLPALLRHHGWSLVSDGANQHWCRPGKQGSTSATCRDGTFYVFSSNAAPFEPDRAYSPFAAYALLEHAGDFAAAAAALRSLGFGSPMAEPAPTVDLSGLIPAPAPAPAVAPPAAVVLRTHADRIRDRQHPPPQVIDGLLPCGGVGALIALPGGGKTLMGLEVARCVALGAPFAGRTTLTGRVIYVCTDAPASTERRLLAMPEAAAERVSSVIEAPKLPVGLTELRQAVASLQRADDPVRLLVLDTYDSTRAHADSGWAGQDGLTEAIMGGLRALATEHHLAVLIIHHATRADAGRARGSVVFDARLDFIGLVDGTGDGIGLTAIKNRDGETGRVGRFRIEAVPVHGRNEPILQPAESDAATDDESTDLSLDDRLLMHLVVHGGPASIGGLARALSSKSKSSIQRAVARLRSGGWLVGYQPTALGSHRVDVRFTGA